MDCTRSWCVLRRYSEFFELHQTLTYDIGPLPVLPPKLVLNTAEDLADRYLDLDAFLRALLAMPTAAAHVRLRSFLGADSASAPRGIECACACAAMGRRWDARCGTAPYGAGVGAWKGEGGEGYGLWCRRGRVGGG